DSIGKGFIDRETEKGQVKNYAELKGYKLLILGGVGEGKSSALNLFLNTGKKLGKINIMLDGLKMSDGESFIEALLGSLRTVTDQLEEDKVKLLDDKLTELGIAKKTTTVSGEV